MILMILWFVLCVGLTSAAPSPAAYTGPTPPWQYRGYESFPAFFFGANASGPENANQTAMVAKFQFAGWGWQQSVNRTSPVEDGHYWNEETALAQAATRLASFVEFAPQPDTQNQAIFVYRHSQMALSWFDISRAAYINQNNSDFWVKDESGKTCVNSARGGPYWNFSVPAAADYWVNEVIGELTREANINSVFFDETDAEYCGGFPGQKAHCHHNLRPGELAQLYRAKIQVLRRSALKLNSAGILPMYSSFNSFNSTNCNGVDYAEYYGALSDVGWFRFYEFFSATTLPNMLLETKLGLPVVVHDSSPGSTIDLSLAAFLVCQGEYYRLQSATIDPDLYNYCLMTATFCTWILTTRKLYLLRVVHWLGGPAVEMEAGVRCQIWRSARCGHAKHLRVVP
jgi:hypothetical protein